MKTRKNNSGSLRVCFAALIVPILVLSLCAAYAAPESIEMGELVLTPFAIGYDPFLYPPNMTDAQKPLSLVFTPRFISPDGDVGSSYEAFFGASILTDTTGTEYAPGLILVPNERGGGTILGGSGVIAGGKDSFPGMACLIFAVPNHIDTADLYFIIQTAVGTQFIPLTAFSDDAGSQSASTQPETTPVPTAEPVQTADPVLIDRTVQEEALAEAERVLADIRLSVTDPWVAEMLSSSSITVTATGKPDKKGYTAVTLSVTLPGLNSGLKSGAKLGNQTPASVLRDALLRAERDVISYTLKVAVNPEGAYGPLLRWDSTYNQKGLAKFLTTKATAARKSFEVPAVRDAIAAILLDETASQCKIDLSNGMASARINGSISRNTGALDNAAKAAYDELAKIPLANTRSKDEIRRTLDSQYAKTKSKGGAKTSQSFDFSFDLRALTTSGRDSCNDALEFAAQPDPLSKALDALCDRVWSLPDYPRPATGRLSGEARGTKVTIKAGTGPGDVYVRFVHANSGRLQLSCYIREGGQCSVRVPSGDYELRYGRGDYLDWQGEQNAFGYDGAYGYGDFHVMGSNYAHTVTLVYNPGGNMPVSDTSLDSFLGR